MKKYLFKEFSLGYDNRLKCWIVLYSESAYMIPRKLAKDLIKLSKMQSCMFRVIFPWLK